MMIMPCSSFCFNPSTRVSVIPLVTAVVSNPNHGNRMGAAFRAIPQPPSRRWYGLTFVNRDDSRSPRQRRRREMSITGLVVSSITTSTGKWMTTTGTNGDAHHSTNDRDDGNDRDAHTDSIVRSRTLQWIRRIVIGLNLCPFALLPFQNQQIKIVVVRDHHEKNNHDTMNVNSYNDNIIQQVQHEIELLVQTTAVAATKENTKNIPTTTLIVCPECHPNDFLSYLDLVQVIEDMIQENDQYDGVVQLASFHPQYCFNGSSSNDPDNCTNRSPYPTFHLLRESDVSFVVDTALPNQDSSIVWSRNVDLLRTLQEELSDAEFTSVVTVPPPEQLPPGTTTTAPPVQRQTDLIFRVRQILRRFPVTLLPRTKHDAWPSFASGHLTIPHVSLWRL